MIGLGDRLRLRTILFLVALFSLTTTILIFIIGILISIISSINTLNRAIISENTASP